MMRGVRNGNHGVANLLQDMTENATRPRARRTWLDMIRLATLQRGSPESVAWGVAIGTFVAFTPTIGFQVIAVLLITAWIPVNKLAALVPLFLTNALTAGPIYGLQCWLGAQVMPGARSSEMLARWHNLRDVLSEYGFLAFHEYWQDIARVGWDLWLAMWIGAILIGGAAALLSYPVTVRVVRAFRNRRSHRIRTRARWLRSNADGNSGADSQ